MEKISESKLNIERISKDFITNDLNSFCRKSKGTEEEKALTKPIEMNGDSKTSPENGALLKTEDEKENHEEQTT